MWFLLSLLAPLSLKPSAIISLLMLCKDFLTNVILRFTSLILPQMYLNFSTVYRLQLRPPSKHDKANDRRRRTNVIIIAVTAIFFFGWLPLNILNLATEFDSAGLLRSLLGFVFTTHFD